MELGFSIYRRQWSREGPTEERVDAAALRLQSLYTGIERCFLLIVRTLNGGTPEGADWHRRLLERMAIATEERPSVLQAVPDLWWAVEDRLGAFEGWLAALAADSPADP